MDVVDALAHRGRFFRVLQQTERSQTAVMTIAPGEDGGPEEEHDGDQIVYVVEGEALVRIAGKEHHAAAGSLVMIPAGLLRKAVPGGVYWRHAGPRGGHRASAGGRGVEPLHRANDRAEHA
jgi:hypothetical protein